MGSKKHKKHHKSEKKELSHDERQEKPLKLVLKVGGSVQSPVHASNSNSSSSQIPRIPQEIKPVYEETSKSMEKASSSHSHEKHKKSKKKKKKKSTDKDKERHERKRKHHHHHHHHREHSHERKEKRRKEQESSRLLPESHDSRDSLPIRAIADAHPIVSMEKPMRDARTCTLKKKSMKTSLQILLYYLLKKLQMKDPQEFFAWPVTDVIAPGYSSIIVNPIDFSTINKKIDDREYKSVAEFKADIKLMCDNAMIYNRPDTVYYKSAKRMWHVAQKLMNREQLTCLKRNFTYMMDLTVEELGFNIKDESEESLPGTEITVDTSISAQPEAKKSKVAPCWSSVEPDEDDDDTTPEEILLQAQRAAQAAAERLTNKRPNSKFGFLRQSENGTTTLSIIHPKAGDSEMKVNLEMLAGKITQGTGAISGFKEDTKNFIKPVHYNNYGSYSSYAPHYDSTFSNLSKDDSDLVLSTYGDELGVQYADSLMNFAGNSDYVIHMADNILDNLTGGEHSKTVKLIEEKRVMRDEELQARKALKPLNDNEMNKSSSSSIPPDLDSIQTLEDIEFELSRLDNSDENKRSENGEKMNVDQRRQLLHQRKTLQHKLDTTTHLLSELKKVQNDRLSSNPPPHLGLVRNPSTVEQELADRVTKKLLDVTSQLPPENVVHLKGLRKAMGITFHPTSVVTSFPMKGAKKNSLQDGEVDSSMGREEMMDTSSPPDSSSDVRSRQDIDSEFCEFLDAGSSLRICTPPTE